MQSSAALVEQLWGRIDASLGHAIDTGNVVQLEHVNIDVPCIATARAFYIAGLGGTYDPHGSLTTMWVNLCTQQFHLPPRSVAQVIDGHIELVVPSLRDLCERLEAVKERLAGTKFAVTTDEADVVKCTGPYGNVFVFRQPQALFPHIQLAIARVVRRIPAGTASGAAAFFATVMGANCAQPEATRAEILLGPQQVLELVEADELAPYDGYHLCVYIANYSRCFAAASACGALWNNPRFSDRVHSLEDALAEKQFRIKDIVDPRDPARPVLFEFEFEVRSTAHPSFMRPLISRLAPRT